MEKEITILKEESNEETLSLSSEVENEKTIDLKEEKAGGTSDYNALLNKPKINGVELIDDKTLEDLGIKQKYTAKDITFEDGTTFQEKYNSGELKGEKGEKGEQGIQGVQGEKGETGEQGIQGEKGEKGETGAKGDKGETGEKGQDGKTPVKGVDYFTDADKQEIVQLVLNDLPSSEGVSY